MRRVVRYWRLCVLRGRVIYVRGPHEVYADASGADAILEDVFQADQERVAPLSPLSPPGLVDTVVVEDGERIIVAACMPTGWVGYIVEGGRLRRFSTASPPPWMRSEEIERALEASLEAYRREISGEHSTTA